MLKEERINSPEGMIRYVVSGQQVSLLLTLAREELLLVTEEINSTLSGRRGGKCDMIWS